MNNILFHPLQSSTPDERNVPLPMVNPVPLRTHPTLGVVAIAQNEQMDLPAFLEHLLPWINEIVIVDDGSTDRTVELAKAAGSKVTVVISPKQAGEGYCDQRNKGIAVAQSDWLLHMDVDERVTPELATEILTAIGDESNDAYRYRRLNFFLHRPMRGGGWQTWNNVQLARRQFTFVGKIHESLRVPPADRVGQLRHSMWHINDADYSERMRKSFSYCAVEAERLLATRLRVTWLDVLGRPLFVFLKKYFLRAGWRDAMPGLISAVHSADATFRSCALAWDAQHRLPRESLERQLRDRWNVARVSQ